MSFKLKAALVAVGLALASGHAAAANWQSPSTAGDGGDLFAVVYDKTSNDAFVLDLNVTFSQMVANGKTPAGDLSFDLGSNANFASFLSAATGADSSAPNLQYYIAGGNTNTFSYFMSDTTAPTGITGAVTTAMASPLSNWMNNSGIRAAILAGGGSAFVDASTSFNPVVSNNEFSPSWDGSLKNNQTMAAGINNPLFWYQVTKAAGSPLAAATLSQYGDAAGAATWMLKQDGSSYTLAYNVPAVPEPGTWALMAAGLLFVAGMARRRTSV